MGHVVDDDDATAIIDALERHEAPAACDVDGNGAVTLADLQLAAANSGKTQVDATVARALPAAAAKAAPVGGTVADPDALASVVNGGASVELSPVQGALSEDNPVAVAFELAPEGEEAPLIGGMTVEAPSDNAIEGGYVEYDYVGAGGEELSLIHI